MENKNEGNKNKIILGDFNCSMDKMETYGGNKTQRLYRYCSNYALIVNNGLRICGEAGFYPSIFVYSRFPPKIQFFTVY